MKYDLLRSHRAIFLLFVYLFKTYRSSCLNTTSNYILMDTFCPCFTDKLHSSEVNQDIQNTNSTQSCIHNDNSNIKSTAKNKIRIQ